MKNILLFLLIPFLGLSQDVVNDTVYIQKQGNIYYIVTMTTFSNSTVIGNKQLIGDSLTAIQSLVTDAERQSNTIALHAKPLILKGKTVKRINYYNNLHQQISGKQVYASTALRDSMAFVGEWTLTFNEEVIKGEINLNSNKRLVFNPDNNKDYAILTNLLLNTFTNQVSFSFNNIKYDLYKFANGKFATVGNDVKLIKKE